MSDPESKESITGDEWAATEAALAQQRQMARASGPETGSSTSYVPVANQVVEEEQPIEHRRETVRGRVAFALLGMLAFLLVAAFFSVWFGWATTADTETLLTILFTPIIGLVGAVTGFYYGSQTVLNAEATAARQLSGSGRSGTGSGSNP